MAIRVLLLMFFMSFLSIGCVHRTYNFPGTADGKTHTTKKVRYLFGLIAPELEINNFCKSAPTRIDMKATVVDVLLSYVTLFLFMPESVEIECAKGIKKNKKDT